MSENLILGVMVTIICLAIQCVVVSTMLRIILSLELRDVIRPTLPRMSFILAAALIIMLCGNLLQISIWAALFEWLNEFPSFASAFYHSMVNFTTLGYGDIVMSETNRLLGAFEAANGVLMFGLTTGFLYSILNVFMRRAWEQAVTAIE